MIWSSNISLGGITMKIGIFDSGIGGLTVLKEAIDMVPDADYIYLADTYNAPYGTKSKDEVRNLVNRCAEFLINKSVDLLLIACNTATSIAVKQLRANYDVPIIGMEPAVKYALDNYGSKRVLTLATPLTLKEDKYERLLQRYDQNNKVDSIALPELVDFAERFIFDNDIIDKYLKKKFSTINVHEFSAFVLGCTHFPYFREHISRVIPSDIEIVDGNKATVRHMSKFVERSMGKGQVSFYKSYINGIEEVDLSRYLQFLSISKE